MLTLKIIHIDFEGGRTTYLFTGERMSHVETESRDHARKFEDDEDFFIIGEFSNELSTQPYVMSTVKMFDGDDYQTLYILPKSECFVMSNGKTVDTFSTYYK